MKRRRRALLFVGGAVGGAQAPVLAASINADSCGLACPQASSPPMESIILLTTSLVASCAAARVGGPLWPGSGAASATGNDKDEERPLRRWGVAFIRLVAARLQYGSTGTSSITASSEISVGTENDDSECAFQFCDGATWLHEYTGTFL